MACSRAPVRVLVVSVNKRSSRTGDLKVKEKQLEVELWGQKRLFIFKVASQGFVDPN